MKRALVVGMTVVALGAGALVQAQAPRSAEVQMKAAQQKAEVEGDLEGAIEQYRKVAESADRAIAATALVRMAECYQKLGDAEAQRIYERVVRDYADQKDAVTLARTQINRSAAGSAATGPTIQHVWTSDFVDGRVSPDGRYLLWVNYPAGLAKGRGGNLALHDLETGEDRDLTHHSGDVSFAESPFFTPDSKQILYGWYDAPADRFELRMINVDGSNERKVANVSTAGPGTVSPDGKLAAVVILQNRIAQIALVTLASGRVTPLKTVDWRQPQFGNFSADGDHLVYSMLASQDSQDREIYAIAVDGSAESKLVTGPGSNRGPFFSPDGRHVVFTSNRSGARWDLWSVRVSSGKAESGPQLLKADIGSVSTMGFTKSGAFFYLHRLDHQDAYQADVDPATWRLTSPPRRVSDRNIGLSSAPKWSPDGMSLAYVARRGGTERYAGADVTFVVRMGDSGQPSEITAPMRAAASAEFFRWFPDRKSLLLVGYGPLGRIFQRLDLATGQLGTLFETKQSSLSVIVSADGRFILYPTTDPDDRTMKHLMRRDLETGQEQSVLDARTGGDGSAAFQGLTASPDGRYLAYIGSSFGSDARSVWIASLDGHAPREIGRPNGKEIVPQHLVWDAESRGVLLTAKNDQYSKPEEIWYVPIDGSKPHSIGVAMPRVSISSVHPHGRGIGFTGGESSTQVWKLENVFAGTGAVSSAAGRKR